MLRSNSLIKFYWDIFIILCAILSIIYLPYIFAFDLDPEDAIKFDYLTLGIDFFFLTDIIITFRTTQFINWFNTGDEIWSPSIIALGYILNINFYMDILSTIPFEFFNIVIYLLTWDSNLAQQERYQVCLDYSRLIEY